MNKISIKESVLMACIIEAIQASLFDDGVSPEQEELYNKRKLQDKMQQRKRLKLVLLINRIKKKQLTEHML